MPLINGTSPITNGRAAVWRLDVPSSTKPAESAILPLDGSAGGESIIGKDEREPVKEADIRDGGKYRSVVKILSCFKDKESGESVWMMGSGWLIRPDLLVTAGHVVYDWGRHYGAATQIKCYIGYRGRASVKTPSCQARFGRTIVTTADWIQAADNRPRDVAFIQVNEPFNGNLRTFSYVNTPSSDSALIGVVGYPGDKSLNNSERGDEMYEQFKTTKYDLATSRRHMIEYKVSTFGGQSGSPIIRQNGNQMVSIGTHCYGGGGIDSNSGNSIGGQWGNDYNGFINLFALDQSTFGSPANIKVLDVGRSSSRTNGESLGDENEEGFFDVFKSIARIGSSVAPIAGGLLGPAGGIVGTVAGSLLGLLSEATPTATESTFEDTGSAERAILAEACLQSVLRLPRDHPVTKTVLDHMQRNYTSNAPNVDVLAAAIAPQITEAALDITAARYDKAVQAAREVGQESVLEPRPLGVAAPESAFGEGEAFNQGLFGPTRPLAGEEGIFSWLGPVLKTAVSVAKPIISSAAKAVITDVGPKLLGSIVGATGDRAESADVVAEAVRASPVMMSSKQPQVRLLLKRALIADTALQALQALPADKLNSLKVNPELAEGQAEGIFDSIKRAVQLIGQTVLHTAKQAVKTAAPMIIHAATNKIGSTINPEASLGGRPPGIGRQPSVIDDLLSGASAAIQVN